MVENRQISLSVWALVLEMRNYKKMGNMFGDVMGRQALFREDSGLFGPELSLDPAWKVLDGLVDVISDVIGHLG